jgi:curved DNA-binding protein CbpA
MVMAAAEQEGGRVPDLYELLGVPRGASGGEITRAWRRRAAAEHPDRRPHDAAAPARFRALTEAYQVLNDPARRAAYDWSLRNQPGPGAAAPDGPAAGVPGRRPRGSGVPVWVEIPPTVPAAGSQSAEDEMARLAVLAELAVRYLAGDRGRPW